ncbi:MAG: MFS transporter [Micrococcales bacterium]
MARKSMSLGRPFDRLFGSSLASHISDGLLATSAPLLATTLTKDPILIAGLSALVMLPWLLFGIPIGGLLDRIDRRKALAAAAIIKLSSAAALSVAIATGSIHIWMLYVASFLIGTAEVVSDTAIQSMLPQLVKHEQIEKANSRLNIAHTILGNFIGTPLGGLLYAVAIWIPFAMNSLGFAIAAALVLLIPTAIKAEWNKAMIPPEREPSTFWQDVKFGVKYLYEDKVLLRLVITTASIGFLFNVSTSTAILYLLDVLKMPAAWFGIIMAIEGVASILGSIHAPKLSKRFGRSRMLAISILFCCVATGAAGYVPNIWVFVPISMIFQYLISIWNILLMSTYHDMIPNHLFGRIHGTRRTLVWGLMPIGALIGGAIAQIDLRTPYLATLIIGTAIALFSFKFLKNLPQKKEEFLAEDNSALTIE